jgi:Tol biopolymer transport system component
VGLKRYSRKIIIPVLVVVVLAACQSAQVPPTVESPLPSVSPISPVETPEPPPDAVQGFVLFYRRERTGWTNIYVLDVATGESTQLTSDQGDNFDPAWSPDGMQIAFISDRGRETEYGTLWLMDADGSNARPLLDAGDYFEMSPAWSPDGTRIAFQSNRGANGINQDVLILDLESNSLTNLTNSPALDVNPAWSPDGTQIAFVSDRSGNPEIWIANVDGTGLVQLTDRPALGDWRPAWSPDGSSLLFESYPSATPRLIYRQNLGESTAEEVETGSIWNLWPTWVDENRILYAASEEFDADIAEASPANIYLQDLDTGEVQQLTSGPGHDSRPSWRPR